MKYLVVLAFCVGFINLKSNKANANLLINPIDTSKYAILSYNKTDWPLSFNKDSKVYSLSLNDIKQIEFLLNKEVIKINKEAKRVIITKPSEFYKQLIAVYNSRGEKIVWVNCMCDINEKQNWKKRVIGVLDGGPCYFNFKINLTTNMIYDFEINGVA